MGTNVFSMTALSLALAALAALPQPVNAQQKPTVASVLDAQFTQAEKDFLSAAEAMPEEKYSFAPTNGEFKGVRTFAQQLKHVAVYNYRSFQAMLGIEITKDGENGSDAAKTKTEILKYVRDSFALGHKAIAAIRPDTLLSEVKNSPEAGYDTPLALATFTCWHAYDHYGQMVEYLRMNRIVPPASRGTPPANRGTR
jgi:DinB superfamily